MDLTPPPQSGYSSTVCISNLNLGVNFCGGRKTGEQIPKAQKRTNKQLLLTHVIWSPGVQKGAGLGESNHETIIRSTSGFSDI